MSEGTAFVFPGWGSQYPGMARKLLAESAVAREAFAEGSAYVGFDLAALCSTGSVVELGRTRNALLSIVMMGVAHHRVLRAAGGPRPVAVLGHSVGEYTALTCAGALPLRDALRVVELRAALGDRVLRERSPAVTVLKSTSRAVVEATCAAVRAAGGGAWIACANSPGQLLVAGEAPAILDVEERILDADPRAEVVPLVGAAAFHTPLMSSHREELAAALASCAWASPECPVIQNVGARLTTDVKEIIEGLVEQLHATVEWCGAVDRLRAEGAPRVVELGPRAVLKALLMEMGYPSPVHAFDDRRSREELLGKLSASEALP